MRTEACRLLEARLWRPIGSQEQSIPLWSLGYVYNFCVCVVQRQTKRTKTTLGGLLKTRTHFVPPFLGGSNKGSMLFDNLPCSTWTHENGLNFLVDSWVMAFILSPNKSTRFMNPGSTLVLCKFALAFFQVFQSIQVSVSKNGKCFLVVFL